MALVKYSAAIESYERARPRGVRPALPSPTPQSWFQLPNPIGEALSGINTQSLLGLPAAWRCVNLIANSVAQMTPPRVLQADEITEVQPTPQVVARPNASMGAFDFWHSVVGSLLTRGNFIGLPADFDLFGYPRQVVPINLDFVYVFYDADGYTLYDIGGESFTADEVVHLRLYTVPGSPWGVSPVSNFRQALGRQITEQDMATNQVKTGSVPSAVITLDVPEVSAELAADVQDRWIATHGNGQRKPAVLSKRMTVAPLAWSPSDLEFLASRHFSVAEMALCFGLDPSDLGAAFHNGAGAITYANISQRIVSRIVDSYAPLMRRLEDAWSDLVPGGSFVRFQPERLMLATPKDRYDAYAAGLAVGAITEDEIRHEEGKPPIPPKPTPPALAEPPAEQQTDTGPETPAEDMKDMPMMMTNDQGAPK